MDHQYIESNPGFIAPDNRRNEVLGFLKNEPLEDLCITRPAARLKWGIPIPFDPAFVTWVWFDALVNYISVPFAHGDPLVRKALGAGAACGLGLSGRPICTSSARTSSSFTRVYWPIMLKAMGLPLPRQILVHGWWQKDGQKLSKSTGNVVDPVAVIEEWGLDAFRYYLVRELDIGPDGNWTDAGFRSRYQSELANGLGNLVNRSLSMIQALSQRAWCRRGASQLARGNDRDVAARRGRLSRQLAAGSVATMRRAGDAGQSVHRPNQPVQNRQRPGAGGGLGQRSSHPGGGLPRAGRSALAGDARRGGKIPAPAWSG